MILEKKTEIIMQQRLFIFSIDHGPGPFPNISIKSTKIYSIEHANERSF